MDQIFKRVLCPIDFSSFSGTALKKAAQITKEFGAQLTLAHIIVHPWADIYKKKIAVLMKDQDTGSKPAGTVRVSSSGITLLPNREDMKQLVKEMISEFVAEHLAGVEYDSFVMVNEHIYRPIINYAEEHKVDLIIMSTRGVSGMKRISTGSVAENIVRKAPCSVMVVRD